MAKDGHGVAGGRDMGAKPGKRENEITKGRIETAVEGFFGDITDSAPFSPTYGTHKKIGSEMLPTKTGGRGGSGTNFRNKLMAPRGKAKE